jgi:hypothetical protein
MTLRALSLRFIERVAMEGLLLRVRRAGEAGTAPSTILILASLIVQPVIVGGLMLWLLTGRGPGERASNVVHIVEKRAG